ncbi:sensor domain-containing diguanylate cyclase [Paraburkholderia phosphatilytica]|uniref:sensor domain-containing diguanylate cyclase n=1 Tax=Paraburkholderia phosphatilytica TaxID=2282883 RepID=UPI000E4ADE75|nr:sensor domain-containing diguanylate cyclase [Paraburkholderia phosphatilytica]
MQAPAKPANEEQRLATLRALSILDTSPEERFDRLTRLAKRLFDVPIALVTLVDADRQWFKSREGLDVSETSRDISFCGHAILTDDLLLVDDASSDTRFHDNPLVTGDPNIRFYAGCPLVVSGANRLGTFCLIDSKPRALDVVEQGLLRDIGRMAEQELAAVQLATTDELTGLSNRRGFEVLAQHALNMCKRLGRRASLLFFDLNGFKEINDVYGHAEGDRALVGFAGVLRTALRESDVVGRIGGDEFVALLTDADDEGTARLVERLKQHLDLYNHEAQRGYDVRCSVGQASFAPESSATITELLAIADSAMYVNKRASRTVPPR